jgi:hypothetical protein
MIATILGVLVYKLLEKSSPSQLLKNDGVEVDKGGLNK